MNRRMSLLSRLTRPRDLTGLSRRCALAAGAMATAVLIGCAPMATYNPAYITPPVTPQAEKVEGRALVYTVKTDDETPYMGRPTSFTGSATNLTIPLGVITREIAYTVFNDLFRDGAVKGNALDNAGAYRVVLHPRVTGFSYAYNQLKNLGFAITPTVELTLEVTLLDATGQPVSRRTYASGLVEGPAYMISGEPGEQIGKVAHKVLLELMQRVAVDLRTALRDKPTGPLSL